MMPMTTMSVRKKFEALSTIWPSPTLAATISAATNVLQPKPIEMRMPTNISGMAAGSTTCRITWL